MKNITLDRILFYGIILLLLLTPSFNIPHFPGPIRIADILLPFVALSIIRNKWYRQYTPVLISGSIVLFVLLTILINKTYTHYANFIEIYKVIKLVLYFVFFKNMLPDNKASYIWDTLFIIYLSINILHYFDVFHFNSTVMPWYCGSNNVNLTFFGLDSSGHPFCKRIIGTLGNPNKNATIFLFFSILYASKPNWGKKNMIFFFLTIIGLYACQSRACFITFGACYIFNLIVNSITWKQKLWQSVAVLSLFVLLFHISDIYTLITGRENRQLSDSYLYTIVGGEAFGGTSFGKRLETWQYFWELIKQKPILGYSPDLLFFDSLAKTDTYSENDFIQNTYRYGFVGLVTLLLLYLIPFWQALKNIRHSLPAKQMCLAIIVFTITSLTYDVMLHQTVIPLFYIYMLANFYASMPKQSLFVLKKGFHVT